MKKYSNKTYYKYAKRLLEGDSESIPTIKSDDPQMGKFIAGASVGGVGAIACLKYLNNTFSISSLDSAISTLQDIASEAAKDGTGFFKGILGKLSGMIGTAVSWVRRSCAGILEKFPSLSKPIFGNGTAANAPTYGSVFCMALAAAAVGAVLYKIYKFVKGKRNKTESVAMYNFRKNYELSIMLDETKIFFNRLDKLVEAGEMDALRKDAIAASKIAAKQNELKKNAIHKAIDNTNRGMGTKIPQSLSNAPTDNGSAWERFTKYIGKKRRQASIEKAKQAASKLEKQQTTKLSGYGQKSAYDIYNQVINDPNYANSPELQKVATQARQLMNKPEAVEYTVRPLKNGNVTISTYSSVPTDSGVSVHGQRIGTIAVSKQEADGLIKLSKKTGFDPITISNLSKNHTPDELNTILTSASKNGMDPKELSAMANRYKGADVNAARMNYAPVSQNTLDKIQATRIKNTDYMQMANGKVSARYIDPVTGEKTFTTISRTDVPEGAKIVNSPKFQKDISAMNARAAKYGVSDPNLARITTTNTQYIQLSNGKVQALTRDPSTGKLVGSIMSRNNVPKGASIANSPKLAKIAAQRLGIDSGEAARLAKADFAGMNARYAGPDANAVRAGAFGKAGEVSQAAKDLAAKQAKKSADIAKQLAADDANVGQFVGKSPYKAEAFIESVRKNANEMWKNSKEWCKNNSKLLTIVAIVAALIACWFGVKKYRASKAKKQASQQAALATA